MDLFFMQLVGVIGIGGFVGEFYRSVHTSPEIGTWGFVANFLAGSFISLMAAYAFYEISKNEPLTLLMGGLLSYQEQSYLSSLSRKILDHFAKGVKEE